MPAFEVRSQEKLHEEFFDASDGTSFMRYFIKPGLLSQVGLSLFVNKIKYINLKKVEVELRAVEKIG